MGYGLGLLPDIPFAVVKAPVFSTVKLLGVDPALGPEMKSTGEILGLGRTFAAAAAKAFYYKDGIISALKPGDLLLLSLSAGDKNRFQPHLEKLRAAGVQFAATPGTARFLRENGVEPAWEVADESSCLQLIGERRVALSLITATKGNRQGRFGFALRSLCLQKGIPLFTALETFALFIQTCLEGESDEHESCEDIGELANRSTVGL
jgi:carbamoyl-phosphate synthase large subunit